MGPASRALLNAYLSVVLTAVRIVGHLMGAPLRWKGKIAVINLNSVLTMPRMSE